MRAVATRQLPLAAPARALSWGTDGVPRVLMRVLVIGAGAYIALFMGTALLRLGYPYPLEPTKASSLSEVGRILSGQPLYVAPTLEYVPLVYGPIYFYVSALVARVLGETYVPLRLVSLLASIGSLALVFRLVQRETGSARAGLVAAGLLAAANPLAETAMDIGRVGRPAHVLPAGGGVSGPHWDAADGPRAPIPAERQRLCDGACRVYQAAPRGCADCTRAPHRTRGDRSRPGHRIRRGSRRERWIAADPTARPVWSVGNLVLVGPASTTRYRPRTDRSLLVRRCPAPLLRGPVPRASVFTWENRQRR